MDDDVVKQLINLSFKLAFCWINMGFGKLFSIVTGSSKKKNSPKKMKTCARYISQGVVFFCVCFVAAFLTLLGAKRGYSLWRFSGWNWHNHPALAAQWTYLRQVLRELTHGLCSLGPGRGRWLTDSTWGVGVLWTQHLKMMFFLFEVSNWIIKESGS